MSQASGSEAKLYKQNNFGANSSQSWYADVVTTMNEFGIKTGCTVIYSCERNFEKCSWQIGTCNLAKTKTDACLRDPAVSLSISRCGLKRDLLLRTATMSPEKSQMTLNHLFAIFSSPVHVRCASVYQTDFTQIAFRLPPVVAVPLTSSGRWYKGETRPVAASGPQRMHLLKVLFMGWELGRVSCLKDKEPRFT